MFGWLAVPTLKQYWTFYLFPQTIKTRGGLETRKYYTNPARTYSRPQADGSVCAAKASAEGSMRLDCNMGFGAATMVTGTFGFFAAAKAISKYLEKCQRDSTANKNL